MKAKCKASNSKLKLKIREEEVLVWKNFLGELMLVWFGVFLMRKERERRREKREEREKKFDKWIFFGKGKYITYEVKEYIDTWKHAWRCHMWPMKEIEMKWLKKMVELIQHLMVQYKEGNFICWNSTCATYIVMWAPIWEHVI
jgi:hypothetical protein